MERIPPIYFADWFQRHAVTRPDTPAIVTPKTRITYSELHRAVLRAIHRFSEHRIEQGQTVGMCVRNPALHCVVIAALNRLGCIVLSLRVPTRSGEEIELPAGLSIDRMVVERPFSGEEPPQAVGVDLDWLKSADDPGTGWEEPGFPDASAVAYLFASSGTTGAPKVVGHTIRHMESRCFRYTIGVLARAATGKVLSQFGLKTGVGFRAVFATLWGGGTAFAGWPEESVPHLVAHHGIERIEASPAQFQAILEAPDSDALKPSSLQCAFVTGSTTPRPLVAGIRGKLCRTFVGLYGSTEQGLVSFGPLRENDPPGQCGVIAPWMHAQVVDENGAVLPAGHQGHLRFRCEDMATRYLNDPQATAAHFRDGWFYPGDIGAISASRALFLSGRSAERINAGGAKINPDRIESVVMTYQGVIECAAFGMPDRVGLEQISVAIVADEAVDVEELRKHCAARLGSNAPTRFVKMKELPRTESGKILRKALPRLVSEAVGPAASAR